MKSIRLLICLLVIWCNVKAQNVSTTEGWYTFLPRNDCSSVSRIGMNDWNNEPAGKYGRIVAKNDKLYYNGEQIKLWGLNNCYGNCKPDKESAEKHAAFYKKFGINAIRLHKYADNPGENGIQSEESFVKFDSTGLDRMDYYIHVLKQNGIFTKLSPTFGVKIGRGDIDRVGWHKEIGDLEKKDRIRASYGSVYFSYELQDLQIEQTTKILKHINPYSQKSYAEDPAIFCVELFNEDAVLWEGAAWSMQRYKTLRERTAKRFSLFLTEKYGSETMWRLAWGEDAIYKDSMNLENYALKNIIRINDIKELPIEDESIDAGTVVPWSNSWIYDAVVSPEQKEHTSLRRRLFDTAEFLIGLQNDFYSRFVKAIRETGYEGEIIASNWQAGSTYGHYLNLHSDYKVGMIDRHNYYGGGGTNAFKNKQKFKDGSMLASPGKGTLSVGLQQVTGRPFMISEWIHVIPNEYVAEGPALLGAYGWGLNGWDVSFMFHNGDNGEFSSKIQSRYNRWDVTNPAVIANFVTIARQIRRMDVKESEEVKRLNVNIQSLKEGQLDFYGITEQMHDEKTFTTNKVSALALAATKVAVDFTKEYEKVPEFDISSYMDGNTLVSSTQQLRWTPAEDEGRKGGYFTINTKATKAFVGFAPGNKTFDLGNGYFITPEKGFCAIYLSAKNEKENLENTNKIVLTAMARARNTGMVLNEEENVVLEPGDAPIVLEPVNANLKVPFKGKLLVLDHDGMATKISRKIKNKFTIDGSTDQTPFYLIEK
nr:hypothetical protein [uncultured Draconibacterium sp.]